MSQENQLLTLEGWYSLHDFRQIDWTLWKEISDEERQAALKEFYQLAQQWSENEEQKEGSTAFYTVIGHKADLAFLFLRPELQQLEQIKTDLNKTRLADFLVPADSYVSVIELSNYVNQPNEDPKAHPRVRARLYPTLPKTGHFSFYPMNKKRDGEDNWYTLSMEKRRELMRDHGLIGRKYAGKVQQMICGSIGFDDWEWGVTLFAEDPLQFKYIVYEMRFDEVSARYGEFGPFLVGNAIDSEGIASLLTI